LVVFFFLLSFNGLIHLSQPTYERALNGLGGGFIGFILAYPLSTYIGYWGALTILIGLLMAALIFLFNTSLTHLIVLHRKLFLGLGWIGRQIVSFFSFFTKKKQPSIVSSVNSPLPSEEDFAEQEEPENDSEKPSSAALTTDEPADIHKNDELNDSSETEIKITKPKRNYATPPINLLYTSKSKPSSGDINSSSQIIAETFQNFGIDVEMGEVRVGPTVTQFSLKPAKGVKLTRITTLSNDLALALAAHPIRIEAPIPGQSLVGIEVPNQRVAMVTLRELLESPEFKERKHNMSIVLGKDVAGKVWTADLPKMPHLLIAGATGSGKTVGINTIILSLLYQNTPETLRFIMVDPKRVELTLYNGIPHLLTPVITDSTKTVNALRWTIGEMERRFDILSAAGKRDILSYNNSAREPLPYIVFIIDELADLLAQ
jgi:S-DNA-T family DNA segregation ATPase FtsK/SpoIIIE